ncbi:hypothetical protein EV401DRAFT_2083447 [Pisolithus croceorrhizus]|nr:hypothetical protein EV401DRAFT_2083447 [Pisolithus croceorrhizus]
MSSMPFGDGVGGAVSSDSSTLHESAYPLLVASPCLLPLLSPLLAMDRLACHNLFSAFDLSLARCWRLLEALLPYLPVLRIDLGGTPRRRGKTAMYVVMTLLSSFHHGACSRWEVFLVAQQHFLDSTQVDEVLASCVITSTTGIPSLIRLLSGRIPMCVVIIDPVVVLSPQPTLAELYTPIPQASSGGVLDVVCPR